MRVVVVGAGVIGVTTAYYLAQAGHKVTVVDRANEVADSASHANGGQLSYSFTDALAKPEFVSKIPGLVAGRDAGSRMRLAPGLILWGLRFLAQCTSSRARQNTVAVLKTAMRSADLLEALSDSVPIEFSHRSAGKLVLLATKNELRLAEASSELKNRHGSDTQILSVDDAIRIEPTLANVEDTFVGAVYSRSDEVADARLFTVGLKEWLESSVDVSFVLGKSVEQLAHKGNRIYSVRLSDGELDADAVVVCAGAWSHDLLQPLRIDPHIYPVRGYSVTLPPGEAAPTVSVTALKQRIVFSQINGYMRIAGFADFNGFSIRRDANRIETMMRVARDFAPLAANYAAKDPQQWGGFRPMTPNGQPRVGATNVNGLYLNTGHGMLGWTLACASGYDVAESIGKTLH